ncbi:MAG: hypothetical protein HYR60_07670 [Acidobacteria bacterium]|nr:hypothetical protein [Acidobacteriota bacterium]
MDWPIKRSTFPWLCLGLVVLAGIGLRLHQVEDISLWRDETDFFNESVYSARPMPLIDFVVDRKDHTTSTVGWPAIVWLSARAFGRTVTAARLASVILGAAAIPAIFLVVYRAAGAFLPALFAAAFAAISIPLMEFSQRTYPYGAAPFLSALIILTYLGVAEEKPGAPRSLARISLALFAFSLVSAVSLFVNATLALAAGVGFLAMAAVLGRDFFRRNREERGILFGMVATAGLVLLVAAIGSGKNPRYGLRVYLREYYHSFDAGAIPFLFHRAYDLLTYQLNLFYNRSLYWPLAPNLTLLPLVLLCLLGWGLSIAGKFGAMARRLAWLGLASVWIPALLSLRASFPFGGVRQSLFLAPYVIGFTALGFYALRFTRWTTVAGCLAAGLYAVLWAGNLPLFYRDRVLPFRAAEIAEVWANNGKLPYYDQNAGMDTIRYLLRDRPDIIVSRFGRTLPEAPYLLLSMHWPIEKAMLNPHLLQELRDSGHTVTLLMERPAKYMESWKHPTCLYFPPVGLWIYKVTR